MKKMHIRIGRDGKTTISVEGGNGADCIEFTKLVENALGKVEDRMFTEEYEQADTIHLFPPAGACPSGRFLAARFQIPVTSNHILNSQG